MKLLRTLVMAAALSLCTAGFAFADQVINASNVDSIKENIPPFLYDWVKAGKAELNTVDKLPFNPTANAWGILPAESELTKANAGKYAVNDKRQLTTADGTAWPREMKGLPFPEIKSDDPMAGTKMMYNWKFRDYSFLPVNSANGYHTINADGTEGINQQAIRMTVKGTDDYDFMYIHSVKTPYQTAGSVILDMRQLNPEGSATRYVYNPGTRKTMRFPTKFDTTEHNAGTAMSEDDQSMGAQSFRIPNAIYTFKGAKEFYVPYASLTPTIITELPNGGYRIDNTPATAPKFGFTDPAWKGYGWWPLNAVFVKRTVWEFEFDQIDENPDRYGTDNKIWLDPALAEVAYKAISSPDGKPFKQLMALARFCETADKKISFTRVFSVLSVNAQDNMLATWNYQMHQPAFFYEFKLPDGRIDKRFFTKDGYVKFGK